MYVNQLAKRAGVSGDTVRYYAKIGMLKPERNADNGYQMFSARDAARLRFIRAAKSLGYTLNDIRAMFDDAEHGTSPCPRVRELLTLHLKQTEQRLAELTVLHDKMKRALEAWDHMPDSDPTGDSVCLLIESLGDGGS